MKILKIHSLEKGWCDKDMVLLHAAFQILVDFMELEKPEEVIDWSWNQDHRTAWKEIKALYSWWKYKRPKRADPLDKSGLKHAPISFEDVQDGALTKRLVFGRKEDYPEFYAALKESDRLEKKWEKEDQKNLHRLIEIRRFLWT